MILVRCLYYVDLDPVEELYLTMQNLSLALLFVFPHAIHDAQIFNPMGTTMNITRSNTRAIGLHPHSFVVSIFDYPKRPYPQYVSPFPRQKSAKDSWGFSQRGF